MRRDRAGAAGERLVDARACVRRPALGEIVVVQDETRAPGPGARRADHRGLPGRPPLLVGVLKGACIFLSDLARAIDLPVEIDFMAVSSYGSATHTSGVVRIVKDLDLDLTGRHVLIVEDIVDSGLTLSYLRRNLAARHPASLAGGAPCWSRMGCSPCDLDLAYEGFRIPPEFVVGYGLDVAERYRNLPFICRFLRGRRSGRSWSARLTGRYSSSFMSTTAVRRRRAGPGRRRRHA